MSVYKEREREREREREIHRQTNKGMLYICIFMSLPFPLCLESVVMYVEANCKPVYGYYYVI